MQKIVYLRMKKNVTKTKRETVLLKDICFVSTNREEKKEIENITIYHITKKDKNIIVIDSFLIVKHLNKWYPHLEIQLIGPAHTIIRMKSKQEKTPILAVSFVWILLFIGAAMTIMNFHEDVSMLKVQQKLHYLLSGEQNEYPLWIQIPYSLGIGAGMLLFFNHWFQKRFNEEPSPLEVEIYKYQQDIDEYISHYENEIDDYKPPY
ncbi:MAG TPA: stage V sporulation protein AA [Bacillota bacterium]